MLLQNYQPNDGDRAVSSGGTGPSFLKVMGAYPQLRQVVVSQVFFVFIKTCPQKLAGRGPRIFLLYEQESVRGYRFIKASIFPPEVY